MRITELLERFVSWDIQLVNFLGDRFKHCHTVTM